MHFWRHNLRYLAALQLLPALESGEETLVGGQAVLEGVMMRSPHAWGIAVRKPSGEVAVHSESLERLSEKHKWVGLPFVRGVATLGQAMSLGYKALQFSANAALDDVQQDRPAEDRIQFSGWLATVNIVLSVAFFIAMYKLLPLLATTQLQKHYHQFDNRFYTGLIDGVIRLALFLLVIWGTSKMKDIRRIFEYHGGEHKTVFAFESREPVTVANAQKYSTWHPRCGTSFLMTIMLISMPIYMMMPKMHFLTAFGVRVLMLPVIAGISYEIIRFAAKRRTSLFALMTAPGMWLQRITTQAPSDEQVECAIRALDEAFVLEKQHGGEMVVA